MIWINSDDKCFLCDKPLDKNAIIDFTDEGEVYLCSKECFEKFNS